MRQCFLRGIPLLLALLLVLPGCAAPLDTTGLLEAAPDLIEQSLFLNEVYYGAGIPYDATAAPAIGNYYYADAVYLATHGIPTVAALQQKTGEVFSSAYTALLADTVLSGFSAGSDAYSYARYASSAVQGQEDENETILVRAEASSTFSLATVTYDPATLSLGEVTHLYATVLIQRQTTYPPTEEGEAPRTETEQAAIRFVYEDGWRIDSPTY